jgi:hypothetical protein
MARRSSHAGAVAPLRPIGTADREPAPASSPLTPTLAARTPLAGGQGSPAGAAIPPAVPAPLLCRACGGVLVATSWLPGYLRHLEKPASVHYTVPMACPSASRTSSVPRRSGITARGPQALLGAEQALDPTPA